MIAAWAVAIGHFDLFDQVFLLEELFQQEAEEELVDLVAPRVVIRAPLKFFANKERAAGLFLRGLAFAERPRGLSALSTTGQEEYQSAGPSGTRRQQ